MKMKDMTIGQIETAAVENAEKYITHFRLAAKNAFIEGAHGRISISLIMDMSPGLARMDVRRAYENS